MSESWIDGCVEFFPAGGMVEADQWGVLAQAAAASHTGQLVLTPQAGIRVQAVESAGELKAVRQVVPAQWGVANPVVMASPLAGRQGRDVRPVVRSLARELEDGRLAGVSPTAPLRLGVDSGCGDMRTVGADVVVEALEQGFRVQVGSTVVGDVPDSRVVDTVVEVVLAAHEGRPIDREGAYWIEPAGQPTPAPEQAPAPIGWLEQDNGRVSLGMGVPVGRMDSEIARLLATIGRPTTVTPWLGVVIHDLDEGEAEAVLRFLAPRGMVFDAASPLLAVSACVGRPACGRALSDVWADVGQAVRGQLPQGRVHFAGCALRCDSPLGPHTCYEAVGEAEYNIDSIS